MAGDVLSQTSASQQSESSVHIGSVLVVDVVGYSRVSTDKQTVVFAQLTELLRRCDTYVAAEKNSDLTSNMTGDGYVLEFQRDFLAPAKLADEIRHQASRITFELRMAIHVGVVSNVDEIQHRSVALGEGMNMAFRALQWALPGEVVLTGRACDLMRESDEFRHRMRRLGVFPIKHNLALELYSLEEVDQTSAKPYTQEIDREIPTAVRLRDVARKHKNLEPASKERIADRILDWKKDAKFGIAVVLIAIVIHLLVGRSQAFKWANIFGYQSLASFTSSPSGRPPIAVVDIGNALDGSDGATRLDRLQDLITQVAALRPKAIGVDIDMGPDDTTQQQRDPDKSLRNLALQLTNSKTPVFLAVNRMIYLGDKEDILDGPQYVKLIVSPHIPYDLGNGEIALAKSIRTSSNTFPTMGYALANAFRIHQNSDDNLIRTTNVEQSEFPVRVSVHTKDWSKGSDPNDPAETEDQMFGGQFHVNYRGLDRILSDCTIPLRSDHFNLESDDKARELIPNSMVIIGSDTSHISPPVKPEDRDQWKTPNGMVVAGMYYHALSAWTQATAPVYRYTFAADLAIISLFALIVYVAPLCIRWRRLADSSYKEPSELLLIFASIVLIVLFALISMLLWSTMFTGYLALAILTLLHPALERALKIVLRRGKVFWSSFKTFKLSAVRS